MKIALLPDMATRRAEAEGLVDRHFGPEIGRLCQFGDLYRRKVEEAKAVLAGKAAGPLLRAEIEARGDFVELVADRILQKAGATEAALASIERQRLDAKGHVRAAATPSALEAVLSELGISR